MLTGFHELPQVKAKEMDKPREAGVEEEKQKGTLV